MSTNSQNRNLDKLTLFQKWVLLYFHQNQYTTSKSHFLATNCCISAMNTSFDTDTVVRELEELTKLGLINHKERLSNEKHTLDSEYASSVNGLIQAKKIMKPVLDTLDKEQFYKVMSKLEGGRSKIALEQIVQGIERGESQSSLLSKFVNYALQHMTIFEKILDIIKSISTTG